ncbi:MAG: helix-turn-helix domain-containing protein [Desulfovibrio sp.]|nr:helix-turn-helix domain-containing protein [Desulfovibrio sp.]
MDLKVLGLRIRELRTKKKLTQEELSELSSINSKHFSAIERGMANITINNLDNIANSLNISIQTLLEVEHRKSKGELCKDIIKILDESDHEQVQLIHRIIHDIVA